MDYLLVTDNIITNVIVSANDQTAADFGAVPWYEGARIGDAYNPPPEPEPEPTLEERVEAMETGKAEQADVDELHEALDMILTGYTGEEAADEAGTAG